MLPHDIELAAGIEPAILVYETSGFPINLSEQIDNLAELYCIEPR